MTAVWSAQARRARGGRFGSPGLDFAYSKGGAPRHTVAGWRTSTTLRVLHRVCSACIRSASVAGIPSRCRFPPHGLRRVQPPVPVRTPAGTRAWRVVLESALAAMELSGREESDWQALSGAICGAWQDLFVDCTRAVERPRHAVAGALRPCSVREPLAMRRGYAIAAPVRVGGNCRTLRRCHPLQRALNLAWCEIRGASVVGHNSAAVVRKH